MVFIRTQKDFSQQHFKPDERCYHCGGKLYVPPVAHGLLSSLTGEPEKERILRQDVSLLGEDLRPSEAQDNPHFLH